MQPQHPWKWQNMERGAYFSGYPTVQRRRCAICHYVLYGSKVVRLVILFPDGQDCRVEKTAKYKDQPQDNQCTLRGFHESFGYGIIDANDGMKR